MRIFRLSLFVFGVLFMQENVKASIPCAKESHFFISRTEYLLRWNKEKLTSSSQLSIDDLHELFAPEFVVLVNGRRYNANYQNYYEFLNQFRSNIKMIDYQVQEYINEGATVVVPLQATVKRLPGNEDIFDAIMIIKFDNAGKIVHWQEVYSLHEESRVTVGS